MENENSIKDAKEKQLRSQEGRPERPKSRSLGRQEFAKGGSHRQSQVVPRSQDHFTRMTRLEGTQEHLVQTPGSQVKKKRPREGKGLSRPHSMSEKGRGHYPTPSSYNSC
ncbi:hypothetical protein VULLAG_LOCUS3724 [Vulpes lagopus]